MSPLIAVPNRINRRTWLIQVAATAGTFAGIQGGVEGRDQVTTESVKDADLIVEWPRGKTKIQLVTEKGATVVDIVDTRGIGKALLRRERDRWPNSVSLRLHLTGLESLRVAIPGKTLEWSVSSSGKPTGRCSLRGADNRERELTSGDPYFAPVRIVAKDVAIPLVDGVFEVRLPAKWLEDAPATMELGWIDFFRG